MQNSSGKTVNLISSDVNGIMGAVIMFDNLWTSPLQIIIAMIMLYTAVGPASLAGLGAVVLATPMMLICFGYLASGMQKMLKFTDNRVKMVSEALSSMRVIKYYGWEAKFLQNIVNERNKEMQVASWLANIKATMLMLFNLNPVLLQVVMFCVYAAINPTGLQGTEGASRAFFALSLCQMLLLPLLSLPNALSNFVQATVRAVRIKDFLILDQLERVPRVALTEKKKNDTTSNAVEEKTGDKNLGKKLALHLENSSYSWDENATVKTLLNVQMDVYRGNICSIIGHTGCGKSSLISAMLGDIPLSLPTINPTSSSKKRKKSAFVSIHGSVSYVPQQAWIFNATVKGNILFGLEFDPDLYERAITLANLKKDLAMFPAGEETEIGEKGVNLSGGQKQRVSIARAIYADADVIILDDPLSALDAHVGAAVFSSLKDVLCNEMGKTIILATNQLQFASLCDRIVVMDHGSIVENGTNDELLNITDGVYKKLNATRHTDDDTTKEESKGEKKRGKSDKKMESEKDKKSGDGKLILDEHRSKGSVKWAVVIDYFKAGGGLVKFLPMLLFFVLEKGFALFRSLWLAYWSSNTFTDLTPLDYVLTFSVISVTGVVFSFIANLYTTHLGLRAGKKLHENMINKIVYAPMSFFDSTPLGRIQNRFSSDVSEADNSTQFALGLFLGCAFEMLVTLIIVGVQTPYTLVCFVPILTVFYYTQAYFRYSSRELKRLEALSRSPLFSHFSETLNGMSTIRAFSAERRTQNESIKRLDRLIGVSMIFTQSQLWLSLRLIALGTTCIAAAGVFAVMARHTLSAQEVGLTMTYAMTITFLLQSLVNFTQSLENSFNAIERIQEYAEVEVEDPYKKNKLVTEEKKEGEEGKQYKDNDDSEWPQDGSIQVDNLTFAYRKNTEPVLKGFQVNIKNGEHIGLGKFHFFYIYIINPQTIPSNIS